jgi:hypothetical protein
MTTDRLPRFYSYLSKRILTNLYHQLEADQPHWKLDIEFRTAIASVSVGKREPSHENLIWLAKRVTEAVSDQTGDLIYPGRYVRAIVPLTCTELPSRVAWMHSWYDTDDGPIFLALCGSLSNYVGYHPGEIPEGWYPSSAEGMNRLLNTCGGDLDDIDEVGSSMTPSALRGALRISEKLPEKYIVVHEELEVLLRVFVHEERPWERVRSAILGAPIWVGTPLPLPQDFSKKFSSGSVGRESKSLAQGRLLGFLGRKNGLK